MLQLRDAETAQPPVLPERGPFLALWRAFFEQLFTSEAVTSDVHLRQTLIGTLAFLLVPGLFLMVELFPELSFVAIRVQFDRLPESALDDLFAWIAFLFATYSMVSIGFITVLAWDSLTFTRRDAMILGPLPVRSRTILGAKLGALAAFLSAAALPINILNSAAFALLTADQYGSSVFVRHFAALMTATIGAAILTFAVVVTARALIAIAFGQNVAAACGPALQFVCVVGLMSLIIFCPFVLHVQFASAGFTNAMPPAWLVGLFEQVRGSTRASDPQFPFMRLANRAVLATLISVAAAVLLSVIEVRRHLRFATAPNASRSILGRAVVGRMLARMLVGPNASARAAGDFILVTLARNRAQQAPVAINAAIGASFIIAALSFHTADVNSLFQARPAILWIPLVVGYWLTIGMRAAFFVPNELRAAWAFRTNGVQLNRSTWRPVRAAMIGFVVPRTLLVAMLLGPLIGWRAATSHALVVTTLVLLFVEIVAVTVDGLPFTRPYRPGDAKLKTLWVMYVVGLYLFAYVPVRLELALGPSTSIRLIAGSAMVAVIALEVLGHWRSTAFRKSPQALEFEDDDGSETVVLNLAGFAQPQN